MPGNYINQGLRRTKAEMERLDEKVKPLYESGLGSRNIAHQLGENPAVVYKRIRVRGWNRSRSEGQAIWREKFGRKARKKPEHSLQEKARLAVYVALRSGRLKRWPCVICNDPKTEGHHHDYAKPLDVWWLCRKHHVAVHDGKIHLPSFREPDEPAKGWPRGRRCHPRSKAA